MLRFGVSIPLEQGNVLRPYYGIESVPALVSLNPFGTGQCLTTDIGDSYKSFCQVSIPLEQGNVLRLLIASISSPVM